jgi:hypothetical protein
VETLILRGLGKFKHSPSPRIRLFLQPPEDQAIMRTEERQQAPEMNKSIDLLLLFELEEKDRCAGRGHSVQETRALLAENSLKRKTDAWPAH